jgi:hypothetical protein
MSLRLQQNAVAQDFWSAFTKTVKASCKALRLAVGFDAIVY